MIMREYSKNIMNSISDEVHNKQKELLEHIKEFRLLDDDFMSKVFEDDHECIELVLHIVMQKPDLKVKEAHTQYGIKNLAGRSIRLDIYAVDSLGKKYNIEIQRSEKGATTKRARYNSSIIDANSLMPGSKFIDLPETYVIFITENDVLGGSELVYHVDRVIKETGENFNDGSHIIYVNGAYQDETPLGQLMHDFSCKNPDEMHFRILADKMRYFKENDKGVAAMCKIIEDLIDNEKKEIALKMLKDGKLLKEEIAEYLSLTLEKVEELATCPDVPSK